MNPHPIKLNQYATHSTHGVLTLIWQPQSRALTKWCYWQHVRFTYFYSNTFNSALLRFRGFRSIEPSVIRWNKRIDGQSHLSSFWWSLCHLTRHPPKASSDSRLQSTNKQTDHLKHHGGWQWGHTSQLHTLSWSSKIRMYLNSRVVVLLGCTNCFTG